MRHIYMFPSTPTVNDLEALEDEYKIPSEPIPFEILDFELVLERPSSSSRYCFFRIPRGRVLGAAVMTSLNTGHAMILRLGRSQIAKVDSSRDGDRSISVETDRRLLPVRYLGDQSWQLDKSGLITQRRDRFDVLRYSDDDSFSHVRSCHLTNCWDGKLNRWFASALWSSEKQEEITHNAFSRGDGPFWFELGVFLVFLRLRNESFM